MYGIWFLFFILFVSNYSPFKMSSLRISPNTQRLCDSLGQRPAQGNFSALCCSENLKPLPLDVPRSVSVAVVVLMAARVVPLTDFHVLDGLVLFLLLFFFCMPVKSSGFVQGDPVFVVETVPGAVDTEEITPFFMIVDAEAAVCHFLQMVG